MDSISVLVGILFGAVVVMGIELMNMYRERKKLSKKFNEKLSNARENAHEDKTNQTDFDHNDSGLLSNAKEKTQTYENKITQTDFDHAFSGISFQSKAEISSQNLSDAKFSFEKLNFNFERKLNVFGFLHMRRKNFIKTVEFCFIPVQKPSKPTQKLPNTGTCAFCQFHINLSKLSDDVKLPERRTACDAQKQKTRFTFPTKPFLERSVIKSMLKPIDTTNEEKTVVCEITGSDQVSKVKNKILTLQHALT